MLELVIGREDGVIDNASIPLRWCIDVETMQRLEGLKNVKILIQVRYNSYTEDRFMVKLSNYMTYIPCRRSGEVEISAYIVSATSEKRSLNYALETVFMMRDGANYNRSINIDCTVGKELYIKRGDVTFGHCEVVETVHETYKVNIPKNVFGKELPKWFDNLVNRYLSSKTYDECGKRGRVMSFFFIRSWFMMLDVIASELRMILMYLAAFLFGWYHISLKRLKSPFKDGWDAWHTILNTDVKSGNILQIMFDIAAKKTKKTFKDWDEKHIVKMAGVLAAAASLPMVPILYLGYIALIHLGIGMPLEVALVAPFLFNSFLLLVIGIMASVIIGVLGGIMWVCTKILNFFSLSKIANAIFTPFFDGLDWVITKCLLLEKWINDFFDSRALKKELLTCNGDANSVTTDIKKIPFKERSVQLIYLDIKNKVCKPMAR